eukprot:TRINITY_DN829_c0_g3_i3.p1 TRINITY_DN829_c0_g3~~TRINITY_DN829_c0_g3_i3.p1  ORF type:complete len:387 (-),score=55.23 TRINITY_DN829_c0_g3_i3:372-1532(-)
MGRRMVLLLNIILVGSFWLMANGASADEVALRNAISSAGPATVILTTDVTLTESLPDLASDKVLTVIGRCGKGGKGKCLLSGRSWYTLFQRDRSDGRGSLTLENLVITATANAAGRTDGVLKVNKVNFVDNDQALSMTRATGTITNSQFLRHTDTPVETVGVDHTIDDTLPYTLLKFVNCIFAGNRRAITVSNAAVSIAKSQFTQNVQNSGSGGAVYVYYGRANITDSRFSKNSAASDGGGIFVYGSILKAVNVKFEENVANGNIRGGGAVAIAAEEDEFEDGDNLIEVISRARATFEKCSFVNNKAPNAFGGAFSIDTYADAVFCRSTFSGNTGKGGVASNGYVVDNGEGVTKSILTNPVVTIPAVQLQQTSPPLNVVYGKGTCK